MNDSLVFRKWEVSNPKETLLMLCQSECLSALKSMANIHKPFEKNVHGHHEIIYGHPRSYKLPSIGQMWLFLRTDLS